MSLSSKAARFRSFPAGATVQWGFLQICRLSPSLAAAAGRDRSLGGGGRGLAENVHKQT